MKFTLLVDKNNTERADRNKIVKKLIKIRLLGKGLPKKRETTPHLASEPVRVVDGELQFILDIPIQPHWCDDGFRALKGHVLHVRVTERFTISTIVVNTVQISERSKCENLSLAFVY